MTITTERLRQAAGNRERIDMEVKEVRRRNLIYLLFTAKERDGLNRKDFAVKCDTDPAVISQVTSTTQKTQRNIGDTLARKIGDTLARKIEKRLDLPVGWMDSPNWAPDPSMLDLFKDLQDAINPDDIDHAHKEPSQRYISAVMRGSSMESSNPKKSIPDGAKLTVRVIFDESQISGKVVLIEIGDSKEPTVKEIQIDGESKCLVPWNERYEVIKLTGDYKILGYVTDFSVSLTR